MFGSYVQLKVTRKVTPGQLVRMHKTRKGWAVPISAKESGIPAGVAMADSDHGQVYVSVSGCATVPTR